MKMTAFAKLRRHDDPPFGRYGFAMIRLILPAVILGTPLLAEDNCEWIAESAQSCVHVIGCVEKPRFWTSDMSFTGRADGWDHGTVTLDMSDGQTCEGTWETVGDDGLSGQITCSGSLEIDVQGITPVNDGILQFGGTDNQARDVRGWVGRFGDIETLVTQTTRERLTNMRTCFIIGHGMQPPGKN